jgi:hypothetical protein
MPARCCWHALHSTSLQRSCLPALPCCRLGCQRHPGQQAPRWQGAQPADQTRADVHREAAATAEWVRGQHAVPQLRAASTAEVPRRCALVWMPALQCWLGTLGRAATHSEQCSPADGVGWGVTAGLRRTAAVGCRQDPQVRRRAQALRPHGRAGGGHPAREWGARGAAGLLQVLGLADQAGR